jgi:hypothetical protein
MADAEALRVQVRLTRDLHPELFVALASLRPRGRADRLRQLALLGLSGHQCAHPGDAGSAQATEPAQAAADALPETPDPRRARLLGALTLDD